MKYLVTIMILLFTSPAFAGAPSSAFDGAHGISDETPAAIQPAPVAEEEAEFKIDERLYAESSGSNTGYYGGGYYGEESYAALTDYYWISSHHHGDFGTNRGFFVVNNQLVPINSSFPFIASFPVFNSGSIFRGGVGVNIGSFTFFRGGAVGFGR
ncbi:MAG: hypothetical protein NPINA01_20910 [Nitrospinaceae bacterium]|nr:MAG: hypothetical protein NPINA01_20910 [Nitrospinaceae bacterium]